MYYDITTWYFYLVLRIRIIRFYRAKWHQFTILLPYSRMLSKYGTYMNISYATSPSFTLSYTYNNTFLPPKNTIYSTYNLYSCICTVFSLQQKDDTFSLRMTRSQHDTILINTSTYTNHTSQSCLLPTTITQLFLQYNRNLRYHSILSSSTTWYPLHIRPKLV